MAGKTMLELLLVADAGVEGFCFFGVAGIRENVADVFGTDAALGITGTPCFHITFKSFVVALLRKVNLSQVEI